MFQLFAGVVLAAAVFGADDAIAIEVRDLVMQLDAPQSALREAAEQRLIRLGPAILGLLPEPSAGLSAETSHRLGRVRQQLQEARAEAAVEPATVTLKTSATVAEVLEAVSRQTGNPMSLDGLGPDSARRAISVDFDRRPFWPALDEVLRTAGLALETYNALRVVAAGSKRPSTDRVQYQGPFRIEPTQIDARRVLHSAPSGRLMLAVQVLWEPRLRPISLQHRMRDVQAVDDQGQALQVTSPLAVEDMLQAQGQVASAATLSFGLPPRTSQRIALLRGEFRFTLPGRKEAFRFDRLAQARNLSQRIGAATVVLESAGPLRLDAAAAELMERLRRHRLGADAQTPASPPTAWQVRMRVRFDRPGTALESHRLWILENAAYLEGRDGKRLEAFRSEATRQTENEFGAAHLFDVPGPIENYAFVYESPTAILEHAVEYKLKDIPLP